MTRIRGVLFDKDGVLFDFQASWGRWAFGMIEELSCGSAEKADRIADRLRFDLTAQRFFPDSFVIAGTPDQLGEALVEELPDWDPDALNQRLTASSVHVELAPTVPLEPFFRALGARGLKLGVATNDSEGAARHHLGRAARLLDFLAGFDSGYGAKPEPGMCLAFAEQQSLDPAECVMIGDSLHDLTAANKAGFRSIGVLTGVATRVDLEPFADGILPSIAELPDWLETCD